ncbi:MAG: hypothetical protein JWN04_2808, partial [Myxococcaceae bacterium]|nr:hypothetical protein [Myxococcaceae bacterium]
CAGFYCGITETELAAALDSPVCPTITAALLCDGTFGRVTSSCAREVTAANLLDTNEQLRPKIFACIAKAIPSASTWPPGCRACALDGVECGSEKCSIQCAAGDGPGCDRCRVESGCNAAAYDCAQLPNPL